MVLVSSGVWYPVHAAEHKDGDKPCQINSGWYVKKSDAIKLNLERK